eukprot:1920_1
MFEYAINLNYCRLCHHERLPEVGNRIDLNDAISNKYTKPQSSINRSQSVKTYQCGMFIRYSVLRPKYGSLAEEMLLNDKHTISKQSFDIHLTKAMNLHSKLQNKNEIVARDVQNNRDFGISSNESIGVSHLIVILIYTDNIGLT